MNTATVETKPTPSPSTTAYVNDWIFAVQLLDGRVVLGLADNAAKRIATLNSGLTRAVPKKHQVFKVLGIKKQEDGRNLIGTYNKFLEQLGPEMVVVI